MQLTMSMFATKADYWKARAEMADKTIIEIAEQLKCVADNEVILQRIDEAQKLAEMYMPNMR